MNGYDIRQMIEHIANENGIYETELIDDMAGQQSISAGFDEEIIVDDGINDPNTKFEELTFNDEPVVRNDEQIKNLKYNIHWLANDLRDRGINCRYPSFTAHSTLEELNDEYNELLYHQRLREHQIEALENSRLVSNVVDTALMGFGMIVERYGNGVPIIDPRQQQFMDMIRDYRSNSLQQLNQYVNQHATQYANQQPIHYDSKVTVTLTNEALDKLKRMSYHELKQQYDKLSDDENCSICLDKLSDNADKHTYIVLDSCHHIYHDECIIEYLKNYDYHCPLCRNECGEHVPNL